MKYPVLISAAIIIAVSSCKTPYKATDQTGAVTDSTTNVADSASMRMSTDTSTMSSRMDTTATVSATVDSVRTSPVDSMMVNQSKDSALSNTAADSSRARTMVDTTSAKTGMDSSSTQSMDTAQKSAQNTSVSMKTDSAASASADAPEKVAPAFTKQYPGATNAEWSAYDSLAAIPIDMRLTGWKKMSNADHMVKFDFKDETHYAWFDENGKWVGTATPMEDVTKLPAPVKTAVNNAIKTRYTGYAVSKMNKESSAGKKAYEIELTKEDSKVRMLVTSAGKVTQIFKYAADKKD